MRAISLLRGSPATAEAAATRLRTGGWCGAWGLAAGSSPCGPHSISSSNTAATARNSGVGAPARVRRRAPPLPAPALRLQASSSDLVNAAAGALLHSDDHQDVKLQK